MSENWNSNHTLKISALDKKGDLINKWSYAVQQATTMSMPVAEIEMSSSIKMIENDNEFQVSTENQSFSFTKERGLLTAVSSNGVLKQIKPLLLQRSNISACHSHGV